MKKANNNWLFAFIWGTTGYIIEVRYICFTIIVTLDPRVAYQIVENVSTISDDSLQEMWAGLFAASC